MKKKHKKILLFFTLFLALALATAIRSLSIQKNVKTHAAAATILSFTNASQGITPGGTQSVDVTIDPGTNYVSLVNLVVGYDSTKLNPLQNGFVPNTQAFPQTLDGPIYNTCNGNQCTMYIALSIGNDPTKAIKAPTTVATLNFQAVSAGDTQIAFDKQTQVFSVAPTDQSSENVLATANPTTITIGGTGGITPTIIGQNPTPTGNNNPTPTNTGNNPTPSDTPIPTNPSTTITVQLAFPGIGANGGNLHPLHPIRDITFYLYNVDTGNLLTKANTVVFDGTYFTRPTIDLGQIPSGNYQIFIRSPQFLTSRLTQGNNSSTIQIQNGQPVQTQANTLISGDIAPQKDNTVGDNALDIYDYNALISCYGNRINQAICLNKQLADLDDNGVIDAIDYNILLRSFALTHQGDTIPGQSVLGEQIKRHVLSATPSPTATPQGTAVTSHNSINKLFGVNIAGGEFGAPSGNYIYASTATGYTGFSYFVGKNQRLMRIPFTWERMQPIPMGPLSTNDMNGLTAMLRDAQINGQHVILDVHNYTRYQGSPLTTNDTPKFADFWSKMATGVKNNPSVWGYELMNEPHDLNGGCGTWEILAQAGVNAIRQTDTTHYILIPGYSWQSAHDWQTQSDCLSNIVDPANKIIFSAHQYFDSDYSGKKYLSSTCTDTNRGVTLIQPFLSWLSNNNKLGIFTEYGVTSGSCWLATLDNFMQVLNNNSRILGGTYWAAGPWWGNYELSAEPTNSIDKPQMTILEKY